MVVRSGPRGDDSWVVGAPAAGGFCLNKVETVHRLASFYISLVRSGSIFNKWTNSRKHWAYNPLYVSLFGVVLRGTTMSQGVTR